MKFQSLFVAKLSEIGLTLHSNPACGLNQDLCELRLIDDIATNRERGWRPFSSTDEAATWIEVVVGSAVRTV